eukprot:scaffold2385_cov26-Phaeocystis_antarctica.AAC.1
MRHQPSACAMLRHSAASVRPGHTGTRGDKAKSRDGCKTSCFERVIGACGPQCQVRRRNWAFHGFHPQCSIFTGIGPEAESNHVTLSMPAHACICSRCAPPLCHPPNVLAHGTDCTPCECTEAVGTLVMTSGGFHDLVGVRGSHAAD